MGNLFEKTYATNSTKLWDSQQTGKPPVTFTPTIFISLSAGKIAALPDDDYVTELPKVSIFLENHV